MRENIAPENAHIVLAGEYDIARKAELTRALAEIGNGHPVSIDMNAVTYVDSTFLAELAAMRLRRAERPVTLIGVQPNVERIFRIAKLDRFFIFQTPPASDPQSRR
jgi:anti-anti-sigma factor